MPFRCCWAVYDTSVLLLVLRQWCSLRLLLSLCCLEAPVVNVLPPHRPRRSFRAEGVTRSIPISLSKPPLRVGSRRSVFEAPVPAQAPGDEEEDNHIIYASSRVV